MDHPDRVSHLVVLDSVPIVEALARADAGFAQAWWHWFFLCQPATPEQVISADPEAWYGSGPELERVMGSENYADYLVAIRDPGVVLAMLDNYRAGLGVDRIADDGDRDVGRRISCPTLVAESIEDDMETLYGDVLDVWRPLTTNQPTGRAIVSGHHMAEQAPTELADAIINHIQVHR